MVALINLWGHRAISACDFRSAESAALEFHPEVALIDTSLEERDDGLRLARTLRRELGPAPVLLIAMSGYTDEEDVHAAYRAGVDFHLPKPPDYALLRSLLAGPMPGPASCSLLMGPTSDPAFHSEPSIVLGAASCCDGGPARRASEYAVRMK
jgi:CheY-like chemotaxis protein